MKHSVARSFQHLTRLPAGGASPRFRNRRAFHPAARRRAVQPYLLADIGEGITECQIISWFVKPGDRVEQFDRICEVQSDKASVEISSRFEGTVKALHYETDDMAVVGKPLLDIDIDGDVSDGAELLGAPKVEDSAQAEEVVKQDIQQTAVPQEPQALEESDGELRKPNTPSESKIMTPAVRHMLKKLNLDPAEIQGTGKDGRILKEDVQFHKTISQPPSVAPSSMIQTSKPAKLSGKDQLVSLSPTEIHIFKTMTKSLNIPHFLYTHSVDMTSLNTLRRKFNAGAPLLGASDTPKKLTPLPFIMKALSEAFIQFPRLNAHLDTDASKPQISIKASHNFGVAIDTPRGLLVPVVRDVQDHSIISLASEIARLSSLAQEGRLGVDDFKDATFTISNIGSIGGGAVSPVIVSPMVGILGVGRAEDVAVFQNDEVVKREKAVLSWSADHRVLDGATVAKCAEEVRKVVEDIDMFGLALK